MTAPSPITRAGGHKIGGAAGPVYRVTNTYDPSRLPSSLGSIDSTSNGTSVPTSTIGNVATALAPRSGTSALTVDATVTANGKQSLKMISGQSLISTTGGLTGLAAHTIAVVARLDTLSSFASFALLGASGVANGNHVLGNNSLQLWAGNDPNTAPAGLIGYQFAAGLDTTAPHLYLTTYDGSGNVRGYCDGMLMAAGTLASLNLSAGFGLDSYSSTHHTPSHIWRGDWRSGADALAQRRAWERWAGARYSISYPIQIGVCGDSIALGIDATAPGAIGDSGTTNVHTPTGLYYSSLATLGWTVGTRNLGRSGATIGSNTISAPVVSATTESDIAGQSTGLSPCNLFIHNPGCNDIADAVTASYNANNAGLAATFAIGAAAIAYAAYVTYLASVRTFGADRILICTLLANNRFGAGTQEQIANDRELLIFNALVRGLGTGGSALPWAPYTASVGDIRSNGGKVYGCWTAGATASSGGPTGTSTSGITDGSASWVYVGAVGAVSLGADGVLDRNSIPAFANPVTAVTNGLLASDGLHPTNTGYVAIVTGYEAPLIAAYLAAWGL